MNHPQRFFTPLLLAGAIAVVGVGCSSTTENPTATSPETTESTETAAAPQESILTVEPYYSGPQGALVASTLISGENEAILIDAQYSLSEGKKVAEWIEASGKTLKAIWITHAHPDHYLGAEAILEKFPDTPVYSTAAVIEVIKERNAIYAEGAKKNYGEDATDNPIVPEVYSEGSLELEGETIEILNLEADTKDVTVLHIPGSKTVIAADVIYAGTHAFMREVLSPEAQAAWIDSLNQIKALDPTVVIPGHKSPDFDLANSVDSLDAMIAYIETFGKTIQEKETPEEAIAAMKEAFPGYGLEGILNKSVGAAYKMKAGGDGMDGM